MGPNPIYSIFRIILGTSAFKDFADKIYEYIMEIAAFMINLMLFVAGISEEALENLLEKDMGLDYIRHQEGKRNSQRL